MGNPLVQSSSEVFRLTEVKDDPAKIDLDFSPRSVRASFAATVRVEANSVLPTGALETMLGIEMLVGGAVAMELFEAWKSNGILSTRNFKSLDAVVASTPGFVKAAEAFEADVRRNLSAQFRAGSVDYHDLVTGAGPTRQWSDVISGVEPGKASGRALPSLSPPGVRLSLVDDRVAKICIGSFQGVSVSLTNFKASTSSPASFSGTLLYELRDHFGVDDDDCEVSTNGFHGTPGQVAMWILQHHRRPGHMPWITQVKVERRISGTF